MRSGESPESSGPSHSSQEEENKKPKSSHGSHNYLARLLELKDHFSKKWKSSHVKTTRPNGSMIANFHVIRTLGVGAFGRVMLVKCKKTSKFYAMKMLDKGKLVETQQVQHTLNEKKILQSLDFPFVVSMELFFMDNSFIYIVMPFVNGGEMFTLLRKKGKFSERLSQFYASQVVLALEYLHKCQLVYRDLKPENIILDCEGYLKLTDFGFCKMIRGRTWTLCGTPEYIAPEIILSKGYGQAVDWWSFGVLIFEMNAGYSPFYSSDQMKIYEKIVKCKYTFAPQFSPDLKDILGKTLQVDLTRRFGNLKDGPGDIKRHAWFKTIDWEAIYWRKIKPTYVPVCKSAGDDQNFDHYDEMTIKIASKDNYQKEFENF